MPHHKCYISHSHMIRHHKVMSYDKCRKVIHRPFSSCISSIENRLLLKKEWLEVRAMQVAEVIIDGVDLLEKIRGSEAKDDEVVKAVEEMKRVEVKMLRDEEWREENRLMLRDGKVYVPKDEKLRAEVIWLYYDMLVGGYREQ